MALPDHTPRNEPKGSARPRIAPPTPAKANVAAFRETAKGMGIDLMPWQETAARFQTATGPDGRHLYRELCIVVARQNGKTTLMKPVIIDALRRGLRVMHIAQTRELPRHMFGVIADALSQEPDLFPKRRGKIIWPRYGAGQEEIVLVNGGTYRIAAASNGGARGWSNDLVIIDELREMPSFDIINAAEPTLMMSNDPQMIYLSNAGSDASVVLNAVRDRAGKDEGLAYLEWSASPELKPDDVRGWAQANPALGHQPMVLRNLEAGFRRHSLAGTLATFETENLCRWVTTMRERLVEDQAWQEGHVDELPEPVRPMMGIAVDPKGERASAALAWRTDTGFALKLMYDVPVNEHGMDAFGKDLAQDAIRAGVAKVGYDPITDGELAKYFKKRAQRVSGNDYSNATSTFVQAVKNRKLQWADADAVTTDLIWTAKKKTGDAQAFQAVRANDDRPITAALAAIRAVGLASGPRPAVARVY